MRRVLRPYGAVAVAASVGVLMAGAPLGCSDGGGFSREDRPEVQLTPSEPTLTVIRSGLDPGGTTNRTVTVRNTGVAPLELQRIELDYTPPEGADPAGAPAFQLGASPSEGTLVHSPDTGELPKAADIQVRFTQPNDDLPRSATLVLQTNDPTQESVEVVFETASGNARLRADPEEVNFDQVPEQTTAERELALRNTGARPLQVSGFEVQEDGHFGVRGESGDTDFSVGGDPEGSLRIDLPEAIRIEPGQSHVLTVFFSSQVAEATEGTLVITWSPVSTTGSVAEGRNLQVPMTANKSGACVEVVPTEVDFGAIIVGNAGTTNLKVQSCGTDPLALEGVRLAESSSPDFGLGDLADAISGDQPPTSANPVEIPTGEEVEVPVTCTPDSVNPLDADNEPIPDEGTLLLETNSFQGDIEVPLTCVGANQKCPEAQIRVEEGSEVVPQTVLHLDGTDSFAPSGSVEDYQWSVQEPDGSNQTFLPSPTAPEPVFQANVSGVYTFELDVWDENSVKSCQPATFEVLVQSDQAIHGELTWTTPADDDETDTGPAAGSDVDLHFAHENAMQEGPDLDGNGTPDPWFDETWDTFWHNRNPNWGSLNSEEDDPSLDRDDTDGAGPENVNLPQPEEGVTYRFGVHYWDSHGFGEVHANLRVFSFGQKIYDSSTVHDEGEFSGITLSEKDLWCVGTLSWPPQGEAEIVPCGTQEEPKVVEDYVNPFFLAP